MSLPRAVEPPTWGNPWRGGQLLGLMYGGRCSANILFGLLVCRLRGAAQVCLLDVDACDVDALACKQVMIHVSTLLGWGWCRVRCLEKMQVL